MEEEKEEPEDWRGTVLEKVLSSLCSYHRTLLYRILQDMREDYSVALALRDARRRMAKTEPYCDPAERKSPIDSLSCTLSNCPAAGCSGRLTTCGLRMCALTSVCICMKTLGGLACQNVALGCCGRVFCPSSSVCCAHHKILVCQHQHSSENLCITHANNMLGVQFNHSGILNSHNACRTCRSPSPPPLSPMPVDMECTASDQTVGCKGQELKAQSKPPLLLRHQTEAEGEDEALQYATLDAGGSTTLVTDTQSDTEEENKHCGSFIGDLMDKFTEKLKNIQPSEKLQTPQSTHAGQTLQACDDKHLTEIITTVLHSSGDKEYNLKELFEERMSAELQSPRTRSRQRPEVLATMSRSPDLQASCRQSLQIKREISRLDPSAYRWKLGRDRSTCPKNNDPHPRQSRFPESASETKEAEPIKGLVATLNGEQCRLTSETHTSQDEQENQPDDLPEIPLCKETDPSRTIFSHRKILAKSCQDESKTSQPKGNVGRSRRKIVPPPRFSSYVTEPRKMYYAACFSESIFSKHSPNIKATGKHDPPEMIYASTKSDAEQLIKTEAQDQVVHPLSDEINMLSGSPKKIRTCEHECVKNCASKPSPITDCQSECASPTKTIKRCEVKSLMESQNAELIQGQSSDTDSVKDTKHFSLNYVSPIKLMLVSPVKDENGVKYMLKAADFGSDGHGEMFDPCIEASWAGETITEQTLAKDLQIDSAQKIEFVETIIKLPEQGVATDDVDLSDNPNANGEAFSAVHETTPVKRRPGRPKKLGPQIKKAVKRPIGRPPKAKAGDPNDMSGKNVVKQTSSEKSSEEDGNKNLKITITYGRSRKARRVVSEDMEQFSTNQHAYDVHCSSTNHETTSMDTSGELDFNAAKNKLEDLRFVMPVEDRKGLLHSSSNIKCQKQCDFAVTRKPGRPPKVKISGISVTVTTVSPRQRRIHMKRDIKESLPQRKALVMDFEPCKQQKTISEDTEDVLKDDVSTMDEGTDHSRTSCVPVRHSVRERKPSVHLLYSVATARSSSRSSVLDFRSHKLLMSKPNSETNQHTHQCGPGVAANSVLSRKTNKVSRKKSAVRFSGVSVDSIFASNESLKWWPITASCETLNEELARRIRLMSDTWVSGVLEAKKSEEIQTPQNAEPCEKVTGSAKRSAVKMLFEKNYSMKKLCAWFMQTTETQSLAIVKKAGARNPYDLFHYNPIRSSCRESVCPSPQAERLRKHVKKFAKVVPKSPAMHREAQATMHKQKRPSAKRCLFKSSCGTWVVYRTTLLRAKSKFKTRAKKTHVEPTNHLPTVVETSLSKELLPSVKEVQNTLRISESKLLRVGTSEKMAGVACIAKERRISSKTWSPETLKECRVFLKKINSPNTKLVAEYSNICSVKFSISPAGCDESTQQEEQMTSDTTKLEKTFRSIKKSFPSTINPKPCAKKRGSSHTSESPPEKMTRQSRSSRGVLGARWCDFVLGPSK